LLCHVVQTVDDLPRKRMFSSKTVRSIPNVLLRLGTDPFVICRSFATRILVGLQ
jgi:hypothetical protein